MRVVCDTIVLVSGIFFQGRCRTILRLVNQSRLEALTSLPLLAELEAVLLRTKFGMTVDEVRAVSQTIQSTFHVAAITDTLDVVSEDPDDNAVLEAAVAGQADFVISGDRHLLKLKNFRGISIVSPAQFLANFQG